MKKKKQRKNEQEKPKQNLKELKKIRQKRKDNWDSQWLELIKQYNFIVPCLTSDISSLVIENVKKFLESIGCKFVMFKKVYSFTQSFNRASWKVKYVWNTRNTGKWLVT